MQRNPIYTAARKLEQVARKAHDQKLVEMSKEILARSRGLPIEKILDKVPGRNVTQKCAAIQVTRQAWYDWVKGLYRPTGEMARRLAKVTGYSEKAIAGGEVPPPKKKPRKRKLPPDTTADETAAV